MLNEYVEVIGLIGGNLTSSAAFAEDLAFSARSLTGNLRGTLAVSIDLINSPGSSSQMTIAQLAQSGHFTPPLAGNEDVLSGTLSRDLNRKIDPPTAIQERSEFSIPGCASNAADYVAAKTETEGKAVTASL